MKTSVAMVLEPLESRNVGPVGQSREQGGRFWPQGAVRVGGCRAGKAVSLVSLSVSRGGNHVVVVWRALAEPAQKHVHERAQVFQLLLLRLPRLPRKVLPLLRVGVVSRGAPSPAASRACRAHSLFISPRLLDLLDATRLEQGRVGGVLVAVCQAVARGGGASRLAVLVLVVVVAVMATVVGDGVGEGMGVDRVVRLLSGKAVTAGRSMWRGCACGRGES